MCLGWCCFLGHPARVIAQTEAADLETQVKAAYLANFGTFVNWPKDVLGGVNDPFKIGVLGKDSVVPLLNQVAAKRTIKDRKIAVQHFASTEDYQPCHMLYIPHQPARPGGEPAEARLNAILKKVKEKPVLLVGESDGLALKGAMLNFYLDGVNVKFEVNPEAAKAAGLQIRSQLSSMGKEVKPPAK